MTKTNLWRLHQSPGAQDVRGLICSWTLRRPATGETLVRYCNWQEAFDLQRKLNREIEREAVTP